MVDWERPGGRRSANRPSCRTSHEIWQAANKIVYSSTLETVSSARTRIERDFDPERSGR